MLSDLSEFKWEAPVGTTGFYWERRRVLRYTVPTFQWFLRLKDGARYRVYSPFKEESGLFLIFVHTEATREGMLGFANRFGCLGENSFFEFKDEPGVKEEWHIPSDYLESFDEWRLQILLMRHLVHLWQNAVAENQEELSRWITFQGRKLVHRFPHPDLPKILVSRRAYVHGLKGNELVLTEDNTAELTGLLRKKDVVLAALLLIQEGVRWYFDIRLLASLRLDLEKRRLLLATFPQNLIHGLWLQFMRAVDGNRKHRICPTCKRWFELAPGLNRADRTTCSNSCRTRAYLQRQKQAVEMHAAGKKVDKIAKKLGSDVATVNKWISSKKER
jgi:hypothetical protein